MFKPGDAVGAAFRRPHRWQWSDEAPYRGVVLAVDDPRAWAHTLAFPFGEPSADEARAHVEGCIARGSNFSDRVPVRWEFGHVYWECASSLRPYQEECDEMRAERAKEQAS